MRDRVTTAVADDVFARDRMCVLWKLDPHHICRDRWGNVHAADDLWRLSLEHVKSELRMGRRAPSDRAHLVAMCYGGNLAIPDKATRAELRDYLLAVTA